MQRNSTRGMRNGDDMGTCVVIWRDYMWGDIGILGV